MKTAHLFSFLSMLMALSTYAQAPDWVWAVRAGGEGAEEALAAAVDADNNVYAAGYFSSASVTFGNTTLTQDAYEDAFLTKYDSDGTVLWARKATGEWYDEVMDVAVDGEGNPIIVGFYSSSTLDLDGTVITNGGYFDGFIAKYSPDGTLLWARSFGGTALEHFYGVATDADGNIYVTGDFGTDGIAFGDSILTNLQYPDAMILKYDPDGNELWAVRIASDFGDEGTCVATDQLGRVIVGGYFPGAQLDVGGGTPLANNGASDGFIAAYDGDGALQWAVDVGGTGTEEIHGITTDAMNNVAVTGTFDSESLTIGSTILDNPNGTEAALIAKFNNAGVAQWALMAGGGYNYGTDIAADPSGDLVVSGYFESDLLTFGSIEFDLVEEEMDVFAVKCSSNGQYDWAVTAGSDGQDQAHGICTGGDGSVIYCGWFNGAYITFGGTDLVNVQGSDDLFLAKMDGPTGMVEGNIKPDLLITPNPVQDRFQVRLPSGWTEAEVSVLDPRGRVVLRHAPTRIDRASLDVGALAEGAYAVVVRSNGFSASSPFIIAR